MIMKGQKISDRYQIIKSIGEGGMANVYLAYDTILDRNVAVKVLRGDLANDEKFVRRFQREALSASSLSNPNIVEVYDVGEDNGEYYIVMEYVEGKHLKNLLKKRGKLTVAEVVDIVLQITNGLSVAHDSYIIHRDIKPQNILILENGLIKITDFGIAVAMNATQLTQTNSVMGSVHYLPPEQASGKGATLQSDIYSIGILMYELLTGKLPFKGDNAVEIALKHLKEPLPSIRDELPDIPQAVENVILKSAAKNPKNRYNDARAMYEDLKTCLDESRKDEKRYVYQYAELDSDGKKFTKQVEKAVEMEDNEDNNSEDDVTVKQITVDEVKKENRILIVLASFFVALLLIVVVIMFFLKSEILGKKTVAVPDVSGLSITEAVQVLQEAGFEISDEQKEASSDTVPEGDVVKTAPIAGTKKSKGSTITLYISKGSVTVEVQNYIDKDYREVKGSLEALGINVLINKKEVDNPDVYDENKIIEQDIEPGTRISEGSNITLYIPDIQKTYPDFTDGSYTVEEVQQFCDERNITLKIITSNAYPEGVIGKQSKNPGYTILAGTDLIIYVGGPSNEANTDCNSMEEECPVEGNNSESGSGLDE